MSVHLGKLFSIYACSLKPESSKIVSMASARKKDMEAAVLKDFCKTIDYKAGNFIITITTNGRQSEQARKPFLIIAEKKSAFKKEKILGKGFVTVSTRESPNIQQAFY